MKQHPRLNLLSDRYRTAYLLRQDGLKYKDIGIQLEVGAQRARQMVHQAKWILDQEPAWNDTLSVRLANCLNNANIHSKEELLEYYQSGRLKKVRNFGDACLRETAEFLGIQIPQKHPHKAFKFSFCPHCGKRLPK